MRIDHLIIGTDDVASSVHFYTRLLGFRELGPLGDAVDLEGRGCSLLIHPVVEEQLPNPFHVAFGAETVTDFEALLERAGALELSPRSLPDRSSAKGAGEFERHGTRFRNFYVFDPGRVNVEVIVRLP